MSHESYCQDPNCPQPCPQCGVPLVPGIWECPSCPIDDPASEPAKSDEPLRAAGNDGHGRRLKHPADGLGAKPAPDGMSEREREALALREGTPFLMDWNAWLGLYDRAAELFGERAKRAEAERSTARIDDYQRTIASLNEGNAYLEKSRNYLEKSRDEAQAEVARLQKELAAVKEEAGSWERLKARMAELLEFCRSLSGVLTLTELQSVRDQFVKWLQVHDLDSERAGQAGWQGPRVGWWSSADIGAAEAKGRREAFAEVLRKVEMLYPLAANQSAWIGRAATLMHWLEEAAK